MYNRYIPQPDGTYRKHRMNEPPQARPQKPAPSKAPLPPAEPPCEDPPTPSCPPPHVHKPHRQPSQSNGNLTDFFKNLLPKELDTADLLIILLLLLMAGDCEEDKNTALLTLALYFLL